MTDRERTLTVMLLVVMLGVGGMVVGWKLVYAPFRDIRASSKAVSDQIDKKQYELDAEREYISRIEKLSPRLGQWEKVSLPEADPAKFGPDGSLLTAKVTPEGHLNDMRVEYQKQINAIIKKAKFTERTFAPTDTNKRNSLSLKDKPVYQTLDFRLEGEGDLESVVRLFEGFYGLNLLHKIKDFSISTQGTSPKLLVTMSIEVLLVKGAETKSKRNGILPVWAKDSRVQPPVVLARPEKAYLAIKDVGVFSPPAGPPPTGNKDEGDTPPSTDPDAVYPYIRLTMITKSDYYGGWVARIHNLASRKENSFLLADKPLTKDSRFFVDKKLAEKFPEKPEEPVTKWTVRDPSGVEMVELTVVRIDPLRVILSANGALYMMPVGARLSEALSDPLDKNAIKELGLALDTSSTFKEVKLSRLVFSEERKGYEAHFVNAANKDEKMTLAMQEAATEFSAPTDWAVKDRLGAEAAKIEVVQVNKERVVFAVDKKYYAIKEGETLQDALDKPLTAEQIKELKLP
jgi:hypothetical protein